MGKRVIEETASNEIFNDDWFLKDSPTQGTTKLSGSDLKSIMNIGQATSADLADAYDPLHNYVEGDVCIHDDTLYKANSDTTGTWDLTKWEATTIAEIIATIDLSAEAISYDNASSGLEAENVQDAIDETVTKLSAVGSASGEIATFTDGSALPMPSLKVAIEPQQDLHGYENPWVGGAGKNKLPMTVEGIKAVNTYHSWSGNSTTINNVTITIETDENNNVTGIKFNGTASADITFNLASNITISNGSYIWSNDQTVNISNLWLSLTSPNIAITLSTQKEVNVTVSGGSIGSAYIYASSGNVFNNIVFKPMIRLASVQDATFTPYSNICPISGWSESKVTRTGKNLSKSQTNNSVLCSAKKGVTYTVSFDGNVGANIKKNTNSGDVVIWGAQLPLTFTADEDFNIYLNAWSANISNIQVEVGNQATAYEPYNGSTYTIDLDGTRYGGEVDVVNGELTVDRAVVTYDGSSDENWIYTSSLNRVYVNISDAKKGTSGTILPIQSNLLHYSQGTKEDYGAHINDQGNLIVFAPNDITDANTWKTWLASNNVQVVYELATPLTYQLTPTQVKSLLRANNIWADTGDILDAEYVRNLSTIINYILEQLNS